MTHFSSLTILHPTSDIWANYSWTGSFHITTHVFSYPLSMTQDIGFLIVSVSFTKATAKGFVLIQTKEVSMRPEDVTRVFQGNADDLVDWTSKGTTRFSVSLQISPEHLSFITIVRVLGFRFVALKSVAQPFFSSGGNWCHVVSQCQRFLVEELCLIRLCSSSLCALWLFKGPVTALELNGDGVVEACNNIAKEVFSGTKVQQPRRLVWFLTPGHSQVPSFPFISHRFSCPTTKTRLPETWTTSSTSPTCRWACETSARRRDGSSEVNRAFSNPTLSRVTSISCPFGHPAFRKKENCRKIAFAQSWAESADHSSCTDGERPADAERPLNIYISVNVICYVAVVDRECNPFAVNAIHSQIHLGF